MRAGLGALARGCQQSLFAGRELACVSSIHGQGVFCSARACTTGGLGWGHTAVAAQLNVRRWDPMDLAHQARGLLDTPTGCAAAPDGRFAVRAAPSSIQGAGLGVHLERGNGKSGKEPVPRGTVVALYAGVYIPLVPLHARAAARGDAVVDVLHLARLGGYGIVDPMLQDHDYNEVSSYWLILETYSGVMDGFRGAERISGAAAANPYAVGHFVNHPPRGTAPSVAWQEFLWADTDERVANRLHTGIWYIDPATSEPVEMPKPGGQVRLPLPGVAIVALRDLSPGEELFMDYKLSRPHPEWYSPVEA